MNCCKKIINSAMGKFSKWFLLLWPVAEECLLLFCDSIFEQERDRVKASHVVRESIVCGVSKVEECIEVGGWIEHRDRYILILFLTVLREKCEELLSTDSFDKIGPGNEVRVVNQKMRAILGFDVNIVEGRQAISGYLLNFERSLEEKRGGELGR